MLPDTNANPIPVVPNLGYSSYSMGSFSNNSSASVISQPPACPQYMASTGHFRSNSYTSASVYQVATPPSHHRLSFSHVGSPINSTTTTYVPNQSYFVPNSSIPRPPPAALPLQRPAPFVSVVQSVNPVQPVHSVQIRQFINPQMSIVCPNIDNLDLSQIPPYEKIKFGKKDLVNSYKPVV